ncbi:nucleotidyltransferase domain-containing protein [Sphingomonas montanisoli]|uniref:Nucleotidyltransferase family protein n=1 Tax=Sphingomonas montanisoli TaxID=2606412 RepID=A0A5D9CF73_9SPHN|nr:nucleotidyltransferase family protein [Sphingomonas montanisoli]TZG28755.1 nucleotidyltransferase family protein [Sphingomonas montanisoli]
MRDALPLVRALTDPASVDHIMPDDWTALLSIARAERLIGSLAVRLKERDLPVSVMEALEAARVQAAFDHVQARWEVELTRRLLAPLGIRPILLKGSAFVVAGLAAGEGRMVGDLDILLPADQLNKAEAALLVGGYEWAKDDPYTQAYYRRWMHELPPLIHAERGTMIDVHHTILPLTARPTPDAPALVADAVDIAPGLATLSPADMIVHAACHLIADGDMAGGLRNLWDIDRLVRDFSRQANFWPMLAERSGVHQMREPVARTLRLTHQLYETPVDHAVAGHTRASDALFVRRLLSRDGWGRQTNRATRLAFYIRSHWMRMPPLMLARHLWIKARS